MLATINYHKIAVDDGTYNPTNWAKINATLYGKIDYYKPNVITANDYLVFGMGMPGRKYSAGSGYRYGFNGKENDNEVKGEENQQDYGMRIYDGRLGRFLSVDPLTNKYPELTPYQFASNRPIDGIDMDGLEWKKYLRYALTPTISVFSHKEVRDGFISQGSEMIHGLKNLPKLVQQYLDAHTSALPGGAYLKMQEQQRANIEMAFGQGGVEYVKEMYSLTKSAFGGNKKALGALMFEGMVILMPDVNIVKSFSASGKFGRLLSLESKGLINSSC